MRFGNCIQCTGYQMLNDENICDECRKNTYTEVETWPELQAAIADDEKILLADDLDRGTADSTPQKFNGELNGDGHKIRLYGMDQPLFTELLDDAVVKDIVYDGFKLRVDQADHGSSLGGLVNENYGRIENVTVGKGNIKSDHHSVGLLAGVNAGHIEQVETSGIVKGVSNLGGVTGYNLNGGVIADSYSDAKIYGVRGVGGIAGNNVGIVRNSNVFQGKLRF